MASNGLNVGWREWVSLHALGLPLIKAKIDSGARTSCLHAFDIEPFEKRGKKWVRFQVHPMQKKRKVVHCEAPIIDQRYVTDSGAHKELRYVISTKLALGGHSFRIDLTLSNRDQMLFKMLLGREAMRGRMVVHPGQSFMQGRFGSAQVMRAYSLSSEQISA